ncbi:MAG: hypothetical protein ACJATK_001172 [Paracoccaceae bacterium]|jgi:hypothetical protein
MNLTSTKAPLWSIFPFIFEQWNNHYVSNKRKTSLKLPLSPDTNHYPTGPNRKAYAPHFLKELEHQF